MAHKVWFTHKVPSFIIDSEHIVRHPHPAATIEALASGHGPYVTVAMMEGHKLVHEDLKITRMANGGDRVVLLEQMSQALGARNSTYIARRAGGARRPSTRRPLSIPTQQGGNCNAV